MLQFVSGECGWAGESGCNNERIFDPHKPVLHRRHKEIDIGDNSALSFTPRYVGVININATLYFSSPSAPINWLRYVHYNRKLCNTLFRVWRITVIQTWRWALVLGLAERWEFVWWISFFFTFSKINLMLHHKILTFFIFPLYNPSLHILSSPYTLHAKAFIISSPTRPSVNAIVLIWNASAKEMCIKCSESPRIGCRTQLGAEADYILGFSVLA